MNPLEKNLAHRLAYEFILTSMEEDLDMKDLEFINQDKPHETIDKLIKHFETTEEYEKCQTLLKIKSNRLSSYKKYNL